MCAWRTCPFDGIHHIDMHMKLLDEETILMAEYPAGVADGPQIEANLEYVLSNHTSKWGTPFEVVRIPSPPEPGWGGGFPDEGGNYMTYTNSVFVNNTILLPTYYEEFDTLPSPSTSENFPDTTWWASTATKSSRPVVPFTASPTVLAWKTLC